MYREIKNNSTMTSQAQNSINLYRGNPANKILALLNFQQQSVVNELQEHFGVSTKADLADALSRM